MTFHQFSQYLEEIEVVSSRLEMTELLSKLYEKLDTSEVISASYLMQGRLVPQYLSLEFQLSTKMLLRALAQLVDQSLDNSPTDLFGNSSSEHSLHDLEQEFKKVGDIGIVAQNTIQKLSAVQTGHLSVQDVFQLLGEIAKTTGSGSQEKKLLLLVQLLQQCTDLSARYIARIVLGKMRLGFSVMTQIDALSWLATGSKEESALIEAAYQKKADVGLLAYEYLQVVRRNNTEAERRKVLQSYQVEVGIPIIPALCQRLNSSAEIVEKLQLVIAEPKYDGLRVQIHVKKNDGKFTVSVFTRSLEDITYMFPEALEIPKIIGNTECILDGEAIGYDPTTKKLLPFQKTITRKRKHNISSVSEHVPIRFYIFDVLYYKNRSLITNKLRERKDVLEHVFSENEVLMLAPFIITTDADELHRFHEKALTDGLEGAVMKQIDSYYVSGRKGWNWVKIKESEGTQGKLNDTLDVLLMGYYFGRGKRAQFGLGALLVGVLDSNQQVKTVAKLGTGMSEKQLTELRVLADTHQSKSKPEIYDVSKGLTPDVWVEPQVVVEVAADELTQSPSHTAGVALRFPRLIRLRKDKSWEQATTVGELQDISHLKN